MQSTQDIPHLDRLLSRDCSANDDLQAEAERFPIAGDQAIQSCAAFVLSLLLLMEGRQMWQILPLARDGRRVALILLDIGDMLAWCGHSEASACGTAHRPAEVRFDAVEGPTGSSGR